MFSFIGALFQIDSCQYDSDEDLWHIQVHATDQYTDSTVGLYGISKE
jgi:hypothetical protein